MSSPTCKYTVRKREPWYTYWDAECGGSVRMDVPEEVGMCFAPMPNEDGAFCHYCGRRIVLAKENT